MRNRTRRPSLEPDRRRPSWLAAFAVDVLIASLCVPAILAMKGPAPEEMRPVSFPGTPGRVVVKALGDILSVNPDDGTEFGVVVPENAGFQHLNAVWSPSGAQVTYFTNDGGAIEELRATNSDGSGDHLVATIGVFPQGVSWSADEQFIVYSDGLELWVVRADGTSAPVNITNTPNTFETYPSWSALDRIVYHSFGFDAQITSAVPTPTSNPTSLTDHEQELFVPHFEPSGQNPFLYMNWSPDGSKILLSSWGSNNVDKGLYTLTAGVDVFAVPQDLEVDATGWDILNAGWSPDGQRICYTGAQKNGATTTELSGGALRVLNADGTNEHGVEIDGQELNSTQVEGCDWGVDAPDPPPPTPELILKLHSAGSSNKAASQYGLLGLAEGTTDPVNTIFGNYTTSNTDLAMPGPGLGVSMTRSYNSAVPEVGILGFGWSTTYDMEVDTATASEVMVRHGDGRHDHYDVDGVTGQPIEPPGSVQRLTKNVDGSFDLVGQDKVTYHFDDFASGGELQTIADPNGNTHTLSYTGDLWTGLVDSVGRSWTIDYDAQEHISKITDPAGRDVSYGYDANGDLVTVTDVMGRDTTYEYDAEHRMTKATDAKGDLIIDNTYAADRVTKQIDERGVHNFLYEVGKTTFVDPEGKAWVTEYDPVDYQLTSTTDPTGAKVSFDYNAEDLVETTTDAKGKETHFTYDTRHNTTSVTDRLGHTTELVFDSEDNLTSTTDALNRVSTYTFDPNGNLLTETDRAGNTTSYDYNLAGQPTKITDSLQRDTVLTYDSFGQLTKKTDALGGEVTYGYDNKGRATTVTDQNNHTTTATYDDANNMLNISDPEGGMHARTFDEVGNMLSSMDPMEQTTTFTYNDANDLIKIVDAANRDYEMERDKVGRVTREIRPDEQATRYTYDGAGRVTKVRTALGLETTFTYDANGNRVTMKDPLLRTTLFAYDFEDRMTAVTDPLGRVSTTTYDEMGNVVVRKDPASLHNTGFTYDELDRLESIEDAMGRTQIFTYTETGMLNTSTNAAGQVINNDYDPLDRLISRTADAKPPVTFSYDPAGNRTGMTDHVGTYAYTYDDANRLTAVDNPGLSDLAYTYDLAGRRTQLTQPGRKVHYGYDPMGLLNDVDITDGTAAKVNAVAYAYDEAGRLSTATFGNGNVAKSTYAYDVDGRLTSIATKKGAAVLESLAYTYDAAGNRKTESVKGAKTTYTYDALDRLTKADRLAGRVRTISTHAFDEAGNITLATEGKTRTTYTYDLANTLTKINAAPVTNDAAGRRTKSGTTTYAYDSFDNLKSARVGKTTTTFTYDGDGNRVSHKAGTAAKTPYLLDVAASLPLRIATGAKPSTFGLGLVAEGKGTAFRYDHTDALGSLRFQTSKTGVFSNKNTYGAYGKRTAGVGTFGYTGEPQSGSLVHLRNRDYDTATRRFLTPDPVLGSASLPQSLNRYSYVRNNPATFTDPSGLCEWQPCKLIVDVGTAIVNGAKYVIDAVSGGGEKRVKLGSGKGFVHPPPKSDYPVQRCFSASQCRAASQEAGGAGKAPKPSGIAAGLAVTDPTNMVAAGAGNMVAAGAGNMVAAGAGNMVAAGAGNMVAAGAGNMVAAGAGNMVAAGAGNMLSRNGGQ